MGYVEYNYVHEYSWIITFLSVLCQYTVSYACVILCEIRITKSIT